MPASVQILGRPKGFVRGPGHSTPENTAPTDDLVVSICRVANAPTSPTDLVVHHLSLAQRHLPSYQVVGLPELRTGFEPGLVLYGLVAGGRRLERAPKMMLLLPLASRQRRSELVLLDRKTEYEPQRTYPSI